MQFQLPIEIKNLNPRIGYQDGMLLVGSCFTEHISEYFRELKLSVMQNPHGILFDPVSVAGSLISYIQNREYTRDDLFFWNELWQSWQHHGLYSGINIHEVLDKINRSQEQAHAFLKKAKWLLITLGTSYNYRLNENAPAGIGMGTVANCHRAPAPWFDKHLMSIEEIKAVMGNCFHQLLSFNPEIKILFTVSPVRHARDGIIQNNRSKACLIEAVHQLVDTLKGLYYFPAYELVIDVLRDYRFFDVDLVHPNYQATEFVLEKFVSHCLEEQTQLIMGEVKKLVTARKHIAFQPGTSAHRKFLQQHFEMAKQLNNKYPFLHLQEEIAYFSANSQGE